MIKDPFFLLAYLAGVVGLVFQVSRLPRLQGVFDRLGLLLISAELKAIARRGRTALVVMAADGIGIALGCVVAFLILVAQVRAGLST